MSGRPAIVRSTELGDMIALTAASTVTTATTKISFALVFIAQMPDEGCHAVNDDVAVVERTADPCHPVELEQGPRLGRRRVKPRILAPLEIHAETRQRLRQAHIG